MSDPYRIVRDFESAVAEYTGAPYVVTVNSCTMALLLACAWHHAQIKPDARGVSTYPRISIPKRTYVSVPTSIKHAGFPVGFRDEEWRGAYQLKPLPVWDSARWFTTGCYRGSCDEDGTPNGVADRMGWEFKGAMSCVSFHASKTLGDTQGGAILHDNPIADEWLRRARFDGRAEGVAPNQDTFTQIGWHCYMSPDVAARLLLKLHSLPRHNEPLPNDDYPDLSQMEIFK